MLYRAKAEEKLTACTMPDWQNLNQLVDLFYPDSF
jgi:hypothetical protein